MKKRTFAFLLSIFLLPLISAQFSISDVFSYIDAQTIFLFVAFGIFSLLIKAALSRFPSFQGPIAGIMSLLLSLGITWGINKGINVNDFFINIGISGDIVPYLMVASLIILIISLFVFKWKSFLILGLILIAIVLFTEWVYEKTIILSIGILFVLIGLIWAWKVWRKAKGIIPARRINWFWLLVLSVGLILGLYGFSERNNSILIIGISLFAIWLIRAIWRFKFGKRNSLVALKQFGQNLIEG